MKKKGWGGDPVRKETRVARWKNDEMEKSVVGGVGQGEGQLGGVQPPTNR